MEDMTQESGSQTVESQQEPGLGTAVEDALSAFGLPVPDSDTNAVQSDTEDEDETPAIETPSKTIKVKHNKQEIEVDVSDDKLPEYIQRSLALDKERERKAELEKNLDRAARLQGFKDHTDFIANLDKIEKQQQQQREDAFRAQRETMIQQYEDAGYDRNEIEEYLDNNPLLQEARAAIQREQMRTAADLQAQALADHNQRWAALYDAYPHLAESATAFSEGGEPEWYTPEMKARIERGYDPVDAFEIAHKGTIKEQTRKAEKQRLLKEQRLGLHAQVVKDPGGETEPEVDPNVSAAFAAFGMDPKLASKFIKKAR